MVVVEKLPASTDSDVDVTLRVRNITKSFGSTQALSDISFDIERASIHALCGGNGSGKSTLIKVLAGVYQSDSGSIEVDGQVQDGSRTSPAWAKANGLHFVHQAAATFPEQSVAENFALGSSYGGGALQPVSWRRLHRRVQAVLDRFELDVSSRDRMGSLAIATQTMVAVARALQDEGTAGSGILVLDEPTASLPAHEAQTVLEAMRGYKQRGHTVIFVTHRLGELLDVADNATFLRSGRHVETRALAGLGERGLIERITGQDPAARDSSDRSFGEARPRLVLRDYAVGPLRSASLEVRAGEIVGLTGLLGSGRSALLQGLFGARASTGGTAELDGVPLVARSPHAAVKAGVAYLPEDRSGQAAFPEMAVRENLSAPALGRYWKRGRLSRSKETAAAKADIHEYGVVTASTESELSTLSGGNQQKVILARWLGLGPRLLLLDEPTQGVDIGARQAIHAQIRAAADQGMCVLVVTSDYEEMPELCDRVLGVFNGRIEGELVGPELTTRNCVELAYGLRVGSLEEKEKS
ncbi:MAG: Monosaccharide-transporting ATPase [Aeromicrobium sp.]|nr:Monosaccharide-transporting ATPase [Aeromicrobium sp.]